ncbi:MAG: hypothetical protein KDG89_14630 [Geminicoccaceae bacterium]|nr:hypothetical protein [Geminicoccaceae bacterium]
MRRSITSAVAVAALLAVAAPAFAQQSVKVGGNATNTALVGQNTNAAIGLGSTARTKIGSIKNSDIGGNLTNTALVGQNTNAAIGLGAKAGTAIGSIDGAKVGGNLTNTALVGQNTNAAIGLGTTACTEIGTIGDTDPCKK